MYFAWDKNFGYALKVTKRLHEDVTLLFLRIGKCCNEKVLHDGKLSFIEGIGQYNQSLFDNI